jgi:hypothetical protein
MTRKRVLSFALPQAIIFSNCDEGIRATKSDSDKDGHDASMATRLIA